MCPDDTRAHDEPEMVDEAMPMEEPEPCVEAYYEGVSRKKAIEAIAKIIGYTHGGRIKWVMRSGAYVGNALKSVFSTSVGNLEFILSINWLSRPVLEVFNKKGIKLYQFPDVYPINDLFRCVRPNTYFSQDNDIVDSIIDGTVFLK